MKIKDNLGKWITSSCFFLVGRCLVFIGLRFTGPGLFMLGLICFLGGICIIRPYRWG